MTLAACILHFSLLHGIDPNLTKAVIKTESNFNPNTIGIHGDTGLMQIRFQYVPETQQELLDPCTNVKRGTFLLAQAKKYCSHQIDDSWVICFNVGLTGAKKIKYPLLFPYYKKIMQNLTTVVYGKERTDATLSREKSGTYTSKE